MVLKTQYLPLNTMQTKIVGEDKHFCNVFKGTGYFQGCAG